MSKSILAFAFACIYCICNATSTLANQCYTCRGINCQRTTEQTRVETCYNNLDTCVTIFDKYTVVAKGCLLSMPVEMRKKCDNVKDPECSTCVGGLCNNMGRKDFTCYQCDERSADSSKCAYDLSAYSPTQCGIPTAPNSYCYINSIGGFTVRGCSLSVKDQLACLDDEKCSLCMPQDGPGCNSRVMLAAGVSRISATFALILSSVWVTRMIFKY